ncbi:MAG: BON domain-containing protein [Gemmataceae bacterium]
MLVEHEESLRLDAIIAHRVGWQIDDLHVYIDGENVVLEGHAKTGGARAQAEREAAEVTGLSVDNRLVVG